MKKSSIGVYIIAVVIVSSIAGYFLYSYYGTGPTKTSASWQYGGVIINGPYADPATISLSNGSYRMYYGIEPGTPNNTLQVYSAISNDGIHWTQEQGIRLNYATFPDIIRLQNGSYLFYFQSQTPGLRGIASAVSSNGINWTVQEGLRIGSFPYDGFNISDVGAQTTIRLSNGTYMMVFYGDINRAYFPNAPNNVTHMLFYSLSPNGINFSSPKLALNTNTSFYQGWADGPQLVQWNSSALQLYFWTYTGIYHVTYVNGAFVNPVFDLVASPGQSWLADPTLEKINGNWYMYVDTGGQGIAYAKYV